MKALTIVEKGHAEIQDLAHPGAPAPHEAQIKVEMVGFCGGDLNAYRGTFPLQLYPTVLGHEVGATIVELGSDVPAGKFELGDKVTLSPYFTGCGGGNCTACKNGRPNACLDNQTMGVRRPGAMTRYVNVAHKDLYKSASLSHKELALVEPITVGFHAVDRGRVTSDDIVGVFGTGIVGIGCISGAAERGATVIAIDISDEKLEVAKKCGATHTINSATSDLHEELGKLTDGNGPSVMIEAVGLPVTFRACVEEVCFTGRVVYIGYAKAPVEYESRFFVQKELDILGSRNCDADVDFPAVIKMLEKGEFPVDDVVSRIVPLAEGAEALVAWNDNPGVVTKIMVDINESDA